MHPTPPADATTRLSSIQALRGLAVLAVILFHAQIVERKYAGDAGLLPGFADVGRSGVDLFFVISGFVMVMVTRGRFQRPGETARFLWGRFSRIYPTYWFYFALTAAVFLVKPQWVNASQGHEADLLASFFLWPGERLPLVMVAWSLIHELWFYLVFSLLLRFHPARLLPLLLAWAGVVIVANLGWAPAAGWLPVLRIALHAYTLEFILGALAALAFFSRGRAALPAPAAKLAIVAILVVGLPLAWRLGVLADESLLRMLVMGGLYALLVLAAASLEAARQIAVSRALQRVGDMSYTVYLSHVLVFAVIGRLWQFLPPWPDSLFDNAMAVILMIAAALVYGWLAFRLVEQPLLQATHRLRSRWFGDGDPPHQPADARTRSTPP